MQGTYPLALGLNACRMLGIDPADMLRQAGLGDLDPKQAALGVTAAQYVAAWDAMVRLAGHEDLPIQLGIAIARGPIVPVFLALDCAPDLEQGLRRITRYKRLIGPTRMHVYGEDAKLTVEYDSSAPGQALPTSMLALYLAFVVEKARLMTARPMIPVAATLKAPEDARRRLARHLGVMPKYGEKAALSFSRADATAPFLSEAQGLWDAMEQDLERQLAARARTSNMSSKVSSSLLTQLPLGKADVVTVCEELGVSRSTLQRRLRDEETTFQEILDTTRKDLALRYLTRSNLANEEISYLLAYSDPNSFFRSFRRWTGLSPSEVRKPAGEVGE
ncbi:AraC family transcriptional regulator [Sulfitobacter sp. JB4-11]|uniref:AraC family transcriptional regulator n=1 Tax=Sulfitobacter rhodophyticola TaxID=3238304 RepID=UPI00351529EF